MMARAEKPPFFTSVRTLAGCRIFLAAKIDGLVEPGVQPMSTEPEQIL